MDVLRAFFTEGKYKERKFIAFTTVGLLIMLVVVAGIIMLGLWLGGIFGDGKHKPGSGGTHKVSNITFGPMTDNSFTPPRNAYGFSWTAPTDPGSYCYEYTITDKSTGDIIGTQNTNITVTHALLQPYVDVNTGRSYEIIVQCSDPFEEGTAPDCKKLGPSVSFSALFNPEPVKPNISYDIITGTGATCDTWLHLIPTDYFSMLGSYKISVFKSEGGQPFTISEITYNNLPMMTDASNLQYTMPFFYQTEPTDPIYISGSGTNSIATGTVTGSCTLGAPNTPGKNCPNSSSSSQSQSVPLTELQTSFEKHMATNALFDQQYNGTPYFHGGGCVGDEYKLYRYW